MVNLKEQIELARRGIEDGQISRRDYLAAMADQMDAMTDVVGSLPLMAETAGAGVHAVARIREHADGLLAEFRIIIAEGLGQ